MGEEPLVRIAVRQFGVFSREQALAAGLPRWVVDWRLKTGDWERLHKRVYRVRGSPGAPGQSAMAAWLGAGEDAVLSHGAAGRLWRLDGLDQLSKEIELWIPLNRDVHLEGVIVHRTAIEDVPSMIVNGMRVTTLGRTVIDLAARLPRKQLEYAFDAAVRRKEDLALDLKDWFDREGTRGRAGAGELLDLVRARIGHLALGSPLETDALSFGLAAGLPHPMLQYPVFDGEEVPFCHLDLAWPGHMLAVQGDGFQWHGSRRRFDLDARQRARLAGLGWTIIPVTTTTVKEGWWILAVKRRLSVTGTSPGSGPPPRVPAAVIRQPELIRNPRREP